MMPLLRRSAAASLSVFGIILACGASSAHAQGYGGMSPSYSDPSAGASYIPYGANMSGFIPYSTGPAGGLGVQPGMGPMGARSGGRSVMPGSMAPSLGVVRSQLTPLAPLGTMGRGGGLGLMGPGSSMVRRSPAGGAMGGMGRTPVGNYPFRQPPSLVNPASPATGMSM